MVSSTPWPHFTPGKEPVPILQEAGWAPEPVWTGGKTRPHRDSIPDHPARSSVAIPTELPGPPCESTVPSNLRNKRTNVFPRCAISWSGLYQEVCIAAVTDQSIPRAGPGRIVTRDPQVEKEAYLGIKYNLKLLPHSLLS